MLAVAIGALVAAPAGFASHGPVSLAQSPSPAKASGPAAHGPQSAQGVVQSVAPNAVVLKELDGSVVSVPVDAKTRILVNGKPAPLGGVDPGFVVTANWTGGSPADELQAIDSSPPATADLEVVQSVSSSAVVVSSDGSTVTIRVDSRSHVFVNGKPGTLRDVKPGYTLDTGTAGPTAHKVSELHFLRPG